MVGLAVLNVGLGLWNFSLWMQYEGVLNLAVGVFNMAVAAYVVLAGIPAARYLDKYGS